MTRIDGPVVGSIGLLQRDGEAEVGYWFGRPHWNQGYATEALRAFLDHAFTTLRPEHIVARVFPDNTASITVLKKCGFTPAGVKEVDLPKGGGMRRFQMFLLGR
ncbi:MAG: GNAT family N-acetyltransferase [Alphaproteobacteria bacterium]|nr:GNAT family N-acetyltransferase [Alphaproteobacteria bacterium]